MLEELRKQLPEVIQISEECPKPFQEKCFEILWSRVVEKTLNLPTNNPSNAQQQSGVHSNQENTNQFLDRYSITEDEWDEVYHHDGNSWSIIVTNLNEKAATKSQEKIALLIGAADLRDQGNGLIERSTLVDMTKRYSVYHCRHFSENMKSQKRLFIEKGENWELTRPGMTRAAEVIKELAE